MFCVPCKGLNNIFFLIGNKITNNHFVFVSGKIERLNAKDCFKERKNKKLFFLKNLHMIYDVDNKAFLSVLKCSIKHVRYFIFLAKNQ